MRKKLPIVVILAAAILVPIVFGQVITKISQFPSTTSPATNDLFVLADTNSSPVTNRSIKFSALKAAVLTPIKSNSFTTNLLYNGTTGMVYDASANILRIYQTGLVSGGIAVYSNTVLNVAITSDGIGQFLSQVTTPALYIPTGAGANKVLTSDGSGNASWAATAVTGISSVNATNAAGGNITNSATITWAVSGSNWTANAVSSGTSVFINGTNVSNPNFTNSATITWGIGASTNVSATATPAALTWITLTQSGTNISGFDPALGNYFRLTITNTAFIPAPSTLPTTTTPQNIELWILEDSVGTWAVTWATNYKMMNGTAPVQTTNAGAIDIYSLSAHPFTNNLFGVTQTPYIQ